MSYIRDEWILDSTDSLTLESVSIPEYGLQNAKNLYCSRKNSQINNKNSSNEIKTSKSCLNQDYKELSLT